MSSYIVKSTIVLGAGLALGGTAALWHAYGAEVFKAFVLLGTMACM